MNFPKAPGYPTVCLICAIWNAVIVQSLWATLFCVGLAGLFAAGKHLSRTKKVDPAFMVVGVGILILIGNAIWFLNGYQGLR